MARRPWLALALVLLTPALSIAEPPVRTFLIFLGVPGVTLDVANQRRVTDSSGNVRLRLPLEEGARVRITSADPGFVLDVERTVPVEDPDVPVVWDLSAELAVVERGATAPPPPATPEAAETDRGEAAASAPVEPAEPAQPPEPPDPCLDVRSLRCMQASWQRFEGALVAGSCPEAMRELDRLAERYPEILVSEDTLVTAAEADLECGTKAGDPARIRRAAELLAGYGDGVLWCDPRASRALARAYEALGELEPPVAATASSTCPAAVEWRCYFALRLGRADDCRATAAGAPQPLGGFLAAWADFAEGRCAALPAGIRDEPPCVALPAAFCARRAGEMLLTCGSEREDFAAGARDLLAALPPPEHWPQLAGADLADLGLLADALTLAGGDPEDRRLALQAYDTVWAAGKVEPGSVAEAVLLNNRLRLRFELDGTLPDPAEVDRIGAALDAVPPDAVRLRLLLRLAWLSLRVEALHGDATLNVQQKLEKLADLRVEFADYEDDLARLGDAPLRQRVLHGGRWRVVALPGKP